MDRAMEQLQARAEPGTETADEDEQGFPVRVVRDPAPVVAESLEGMSVPAMGTGLRDVDPSEVLTTGMILGRGEADGDDDLHRPSHSG